MLASKTNLVEELVKQRHKKTTTEAILEEVTAILNQNQSQRNRIKNQLAIENSTIANHFNIDLLETERIFTLQQIQNVCVDYRLRFLDSHLFQNGIPEEAITRIHHLENEHQSQLNGFKIMAPSKTFGLKNYDDPLLFAPIGNNYYYLIHQWGNDMSAWRKWKFKPIKNIENFLIYSVILSCIVALLTPETNLSKQIPMASLIIFLFAFKSIVGVALYYFFMMGKNFNSEIWNREFKEN
jgi:hypothetical protein